MTATAQPLTSPICSNWLTGFGPKELVLSTGLGSGPIRPPNDGPVTGGTRFQTALICELGSETEVPRFQSWDLEGVF